MAKEKQQNQIEALKKALTAYPAGAALDVLTPIAAALGFSRNTLIRRLAQMVDAGDITKTGVTRAARYHPSHSPISLTHDSAIPLSDTATSLLRSVSRPLALRRPVAYDRKFLAAYRPNRTFYLTEPDRARLHAIGTPGTREVTPQPAGTYAQAMLSRLLIDLAWNSSRLEGNTYSLLETKRLLDLGEEADGKGSKNAQMILNHKDAIEFLVSSAEDIAFNRYTILNLHALLANNLIEEQSGAGRVRHEVVGISASVYHPPEIPQLIEECLDQILRLASATRDPFEQAFFVMVHLPYLQPFIDVNKRVSRLAANIPLIKNNLSPLSFVEVPNELYTSGLLAIYELKQIELLKDVFMWAYERSAKRYVAVRQSLGEPDKFRLKFRNQLIEIAGQIVRGGLTPTVEEVTRAASGLVPAEHLDDFVRMTIRDLENLHEGNFARFRLRPSEYHAWRDQLRSA